MNEINIVGKRVGKGYPVFVVAEVSCNHRQDYGEAVRIIEAAKEAGADAVKLQTYTPETMTIDSDKKWFYVGGNDAPDSWKKINLYSIYQKAYTPWEWQPKLKKLAEGLGLVFFSTPFDETAVDFLEQMNVPCYKIASYEATDIPLLKKVANTGKPVIISIGFANLSEVEFSIKTLRENGAKEIAVLHCVTTYTDKPDPKKMNLSTIEDIAKRFDVVAGFSDNNAGIEAPVAAAAAGASIIEKHLLLEYGRGSFDDRFSLDVKDFKKMVEGIRTASSIENKDYLGKPQYGPTGPEEEGYRNLRRSIFVVKDMKKGETFARENVRVIRPAAGLESKYFEEILGTHASSDIELGTPLSWELVEKKK